MGVLHQPSKVRIEDSSEINYGDYIFDSDIEDEVRAEENRVDASNTPIVKRKKSKSRLSDRHFLQIPERGTDGINVKKNMGARKWRRIENARLLLSFANADDLNEDYEDLFPSTITAFAKLFIDQENMKAWNNFIEKSEDDQRRFLEEVDLSKKYDGNILGGKVVKMPKDLTPDEKRAYHPAFSADASFQRLNSKFKSALLKRRVPLNLVDKIEHQLREFFETSPNGVFIENSNGSFQRLYVHAVSNFLSLHSSSITIDPSNKMVEIKNNRKCFIPPHEFLVPYLLKHFHKPKKYDDS